MTTVPMTYGRAKRAIACKGWKWTRGMLVGNGWSVLWLYDNGDICVGYAGDDRPPRRMKPAECVGPLWHPELSDPATLGCLLRLVREAWGDSTLALLPVDESIPTRWAWCEDGLRAPAMLAKAYNDYGWESEALAMVLLLEEAP